MLTDRFKNHLVTVCKQHRWVLVAGIVGLLVLEIALLLVEKPHIELDISSRVSGILNREGYRRVKLEVSGREVVLNGFVSSTTAANHAVGFSEKGNGVRSVTSKLEIAPLRLPHLIISRNLKNDLKLEGEVPTQLLVNKFVELVKSTISHHGFLSLLHADPEVTDPEWVDSIEAILVEGNYLSGMDIEIGAGQLSLGGVIADESGYNVLIQRIRQFTKNQDLSFVNKIGIKPTTEMLAERELDNAGNNTDAEESKNRADVSQSNGLDEVEWGQIQPVPVISEDAVSASTREANVAVMTTDSEADPKTEARDKIGVDGETNSADQQKSLEDGQITTIEHGIKRENCQVQLNDSLASRPITFSSNSAVIPVDNHTILEKVYKILLMCPTFDIFVEGHTDSRGNSAENRMLSDQRAEAVMQVLIGLGVDTRRISAEGFGAGKPVASNETATGRQQNRRIEIILTD